MGRWRSVTMGGGLVAVVAGIALCLGSAGMASGDDGTVLRLSPASQNAPVGGDPFKIEVDVDNVQNLGAYDVTLSFDQSVLEYTGMIDGGFLKSTGRSASCSQTSAATANTYGALHLDCNTLGLVAGDAGTPGPTGSGALAILGFKPKGAGSTTIEFQGLTDAYAVRPADPGTGDPGEYGLTALSSVETCAAGDCPVGLDIPLTAQGSTIRVYDAAAEGEPTGVPPTPAPHKKTPVSNVEATVRAVLGTPERTLPQPGSTPVPGGAVSGSDAASSGGSGSGSAGAGRTGNVAAGSRGPGATGAPVAGYGPAPRSTSPWPGRLGAALAVVGGLVIVAGAGARRRSDAA